MYLLPFYGGVFVAAMLLTWMLYKQAARLNLLDQPIERSAHSHPTPRGGGLSIVLMFALTTIYFYVSGNIPKNEFLALCAAFAIAVSGLLDDLLSLRLRWRLPVQFFAAVWVVYWLGGVAPIDFGFFVLSDSLLLSLMGILALIWLLNLYNFMDGIDGLATAEMLFVNVMTLLLVMNGNGEVISLLSASLLAAGAGFLLLNMAPAKIFLGDVGSGFIGFVLGVLALISMQSQLLTVWTWFILLGVFVVDSSLTLAIRLKHKQKWYEGHASHAYQNAARRYKSHGKVTIRVLVINCFWLAPLAWLTVRAPEYGMIICFVALSPLILLARRFEAGKLTEFAK